MALDAARRQQIIDRIANRIAGLGMTAPAVLFLEMNKPLAFLGAQLLFAAQPFLSMTFDQADLRDFAEIIEDGAGVEHLIARLESIRTEQSLTPKLR
jgi:hypothetical protein